MSDAPHSLHDEPAPDATDAGNRASSATTPGSPTAGSPSPRSPEPISARPRMDRAHQRFMILLTVFEIGASILAVSLVKRHGGSDFQAYMWSLVPPAIGGVVYWVRTRHASGASLVILAFNLLSALVALLGSHDSKVLLYKDCFVTGIIGVLFAGSLLLPRPLTFWFGQRFTTDGSTEGLAWWDGLWQYPRFRAMQRLICVVWGVIMLFEAGLKAFVIRHTSFQNGYAATQVIPIAATILGIVLTMAIAARGTRRANADRTS